MPICEQMSSSKRSCRSTALPVLSEEAAIPFEQRCNWQRFWLVDPLDGTKDFIAHNDEFTVNIALVENGIPVIGVVSAPALNRTWYASIGAGAWQSDGGSISAISALAPWPVKPRMFVSRFHDVPESLEFARLNGVEDMVRAGASSKLARVAASDAEFYPRFAGTSEWDIAAGDAILTEAGGMLAHNFGPGAEIQQAQPAKPVLCGLAPPAALGRHKASLHHVSRVE
jgi:3'(2'), 5'-bisphosphate nucleotidase